MKQLILILVSLSIFSCNQNKENNILKIDVSKDIVIPKHYIVTKAQNDIIIDGKKMGAASKGFVLMPNIGFRREVRGQIEVVGLDGLAYELLIPGPRK